MHPTGSFCQNPKKSTGAGDRLNAGICLGLALVRSLASWGGSDMQALFFEGGVCGDRTIFSAAWLAANDKVPSAECVATTKTDS
jgi:hypothetical protein